MDLNQYIVKNESHKPFHNSGFAVVANGSHFGATSDVSFDQRQQIERNRQLVASYQRSTLGNSYGVLRAKPVVRRAIRRSSMPQRPSLQQRNSISSGPRHFKEPAMRAYNPYG